MKDYYSILGISKSASQDEIKRAYRKKAFQFHPDKGGDEKKFKEVNEAYQVLSNAKKRAHYDQFGSAGPGFDAGGFGFDPRGADFGGFDFNGFDTGGIRFEFGGLGDIFDTFFSGAFSTVNAELEITPSQAVLGDKLKVSAGGETLEFTIPPGTQDGSQFKFQGRGNAVRTRRGTKRGDLILTVRVRVPQKPSKEQKELWEKLKELDKEPKRKSWFEF